MPREKNRNASTCAPFPCHFYAKRSEKQPAESHPFISRVISLKNKMSLPCFKSSTGSLVKDTIVSKAKIMDMLALYLDRSVCPGSRGVPLIQRWEHLADEFKVQEDKKRQCENFTGIQSPSENMFSYLCATRVSLTIKTIKEKLKEIGRNDIICEMEKNSRLGGKTPSMLSCPKIL